VIISEKKTKKRDLDGLAKSLKTKMPYKHSFSIKGDVNLDI